MRFAVIVLAACRFTPGGGSAVTDARSDAAIDSPADGSGEPPTPIDFVIEAEAYSAKTDSATRAWSPTTMVGGFSGAAYMQCGPQTGAFCPNDANLDSCAASLDYALAVPVAATYHVHLRVLAVDASDDSAWYGVDGAAAPDAIDFPQGQPWTWSTGATTFALAAGNHTVTLWQRECGARVDVVAVTTSAMPPP